MTIQPLSGEPVGSKAARRTEEAGRGGEAVAPVSPVVRPESADRVEISAEGQVRAREAGIVGSQVDPLDPRRLDAIRLRMQEGGYDAPGIAEEVARRIMDSGDLG